MQLFEQLLLLGFMIVFGLTCAIVPLAILWLLSRGARPGRWFFGIAWLIGFLAVEIEAVQIISGRGYLGLCWATDVQTASEQYFPCSISEWRMQEMLRNWPLRISGAIAQSVFFALLASWWTRRVTTQAKFKS